MTIIRTPIVGSDGKVVDASLPTRLTDASLAAEFAAKSVETSKLDASQKGAASGVAALDSGSKLLETNIPARLADANLSATFVPKWKATTAYLAGDKVLSPGGDVVSAKVDFTSGGSYNAGDWNISSTYATPAQAAGAAAGLAIVFGGL